MFKRSTKLAAAFLGGTALIGGLTACGTGDDSDSGDGSKRSEGKKASSAKSEPFTGKSGPEIFNSAIKATQGASSLTLGFDLDTTDGPMKGKMASNLDADCSGNLAIGADGTVGLIRTGPTVYLKYDEKFLRAQSTGEPAAETDAVVDMLADRWVKTTADDKDVKDLAAFCDLKSLLAEFESDDNVARKGKLTTVDGKKAITLTETDGEAKYTIYVAAEGKPYLLKIEQTGGEDSGTTSFSDYEKPVDAKAPAAEDIVDLDSLGG